MIYLTFNDSPSGIYQSQVIDVVKLLRSLGDANTKLVAMISLRNYRKNRRWIKQRMPDALVLPMVPGLGRWRMNHMVLRMACFISGVRKPKEVICRGPFATILAKKVFGKKSTIIHDGRGAVAAEAEEYGVYHGTALDAQMHAIELECLQAADRHIAVSKKLVEYWEHRFGVALRAQVIPCSISDQFLHVPNANRAAFNLADGAVVIVFAGSSSGWHSFNLLEAFMNKMLMELEQVQFLCLTKTNDVLEELIKKFPGRVVLKWLPVEEVPAALVCADYGLLIRESSVTNQVASPVKFAEYLACGLKVIISEGIGDFTEFVRTNDCGVVWAEESSPMNPAKVSHQEKQRTKELALSHFSKRSELIREAYNSIINP